MGADLLQSAGITTVLVTHDQAEALSFADQVAVMGAGRLLQTGSPKELYLRPQSPMIASFLGNAIILPATVADGWASCTLGRVAVDDHCLCGEGTIMLRPEQILLTESAQSPDGKVIDVEFAGASCNVTLLPAREGSATITLLQPGFRLLTSGADVEITIAGRAHVFGANQCPSPENTLSQPT
jgi:iron(III) transport system ATP-binding protein